jgi:hypothetical protein
MVISHAECEDLTNISVVPASDHGVAIPTITLVSSAAQDIPYSFVATPAKCANAYLHVPQTIPTEVNTWVTLDADNNKFKVAVRQLNNGMLGPYNLSVKTTTLEGTTIATAGTWTRAIKWQEQCNDSIIVWTPIATETTWTLNVAGQELNLAN